MNSNVEKRARDAEGAVLEFVRSHEPFFSANFHDFFPRTDDVDGVRRRKSPPSSFSTLFPRKSFFLGWRREWVLSPTLGFCCLSRRAPLQKTKVHVLEKKTLNYDKIQDTRMDWQRLEIDLALQMKESRIRHQLIKIDGLMQPRSYAHISAEIAVVAACMTIIRSKRKYFHFDLAKRQSVLSILDQMLTI